ncbi:hypothetical protein EDD11_009144 [Mortierella claussenii]|nr:hypothetical protein EDD11_009144 [Mortierella claussenii]
MADRQPDETSTAPSDTAAADDIDRSLQQKLLHRHDAPSFDHDYDELVDEDWLDMDTAAHSHHHASGRSGSSNSQGNNSSNASPLSTLTNDNHKVSAASTATADSVEHSNLMPASSVLLDAHSPSPLSMSFASDFEVESNTVPTAPTTDAIETAIETTAASPPFSQTVSTASGPSELQSQQLQQQESVSGPTSPSSSSDSEYSLLNPSAEQSRKNSLSSPVGFHALTPSSPATATASHLSQDQDQLDSVEASVTSPSFSDFVQLASDQGDDFSAIDSVSTRSSSNETSSSTSSERRHALDSNEENEDAESFSQSMPSINIVSLQQGNGADGSTDIIAGNVMRAQGHTHTGAQIAAAASSSSPSTTSLLSHAVAPPVSQETPTARRRLYRTTVEDAATSSEDERGSSGRSSGVKDRSSRAQPDHQEDIRKSFFSAARATSTMPGGLNLGIDAEIPEYGRGTTSAAAAVNDPPVDERQCRICLGGADEEDTLGRLISPCLCKGSMKYVHVECLNAWRARSPKRESHYKCDTCKYSFSFRRTSFARYLAHPLTVFVLTLIVFAMAVFAAGFAMKLLLYLTMDEPQEFIYPVDIDDYDDVELLRLKESVVIFRTPDSLRAVFRIDKTHMVFGSFFVSIIGFLQLLLSTLWMGGGGGVFRIGGFGLGGGRRRGARGERQREAGIGGLLMVVMLVFGLFKSVYMTYQFVHRMSRRVLAKAELMVLEVQ